MGEYLRDDRAEDQAYFERRAKEELAKGTTCRDEVVAMAHLKMAQEYLKRVKELRHRSRH